MNHKLANGMKIWKGNGNTLFCLKGLEILHHERRGKVNTIMMEHLNSILFHKSGTANKQHNNQSINQSSSYSTVWKVWLDALGEGYSSAAQLGCKRTFVHRKVMIYFQMQNLNNISDILAMSPICE